MMIRIASLSVVLGIAFGSAPSIARIVGFDDSKITYEYPDGPRFNPKAEAFLSFGDEIDCDSAKVEDGTGNGEGKQGCDDAHVTTLGRENNSVRPLNELEKKLPRAMGEPVDAP
jgi:hypothetical protein